MYWQKRFNRKNPTQKIEEEMLKIREKHKDYGCLRMTEELRKRMKAYSYQLKKHKIFQSMSRKGNCLDNSPMENFFSLLKQEIFHGETYRSFDELKTAIDRYIYYYNHERMKKKLNYQSPVQFRKSAQIAA